MESLVVAVIKNLDVWDGFEKIQKWRTKVMGKIESWWGSLVGAPGSLPFEFQAIPANGANRITKMQNQCIFGVFGPYHTGSVDLGLGSVLKSCAACGNERFRRWNLRRPKHGCRDTGNCPSCPVKVAKLGFFCRPSWGRFFSF